jgi:hypothetical protein
VTSTRAIAVESPAWTREPFQPTSALWIGGDARTRVTLFAMNLNWRPGDNASVLTADAEDAAHHIYPMKVEHVQLMPGYDWLYAIIIRLDDQMGDLGDVLVRISAYGVSSNRVRIGIGHIGGGPPDDQGAVPTPTSIIVQGRITAEGAGLGSVAVKLSGKQTGSAITDNNGLYSFMVTEFGDYTITPSAPYDTFTPLSQTFNNLSGNRTADFVATPLFFNIKAQVKDENGSNMSGVTLTLSGGQQASVTTDQSGSYTFTNLRAGRSYTVTASKTDYDFGPLGQTINGLSKDETLNVSGALKFYTLSGRIIDDDGNSFIGLPVTLSDGTLTSMTRTNDAGIYTLSAKAHGNYSITPSPAPYLTLHTLSRNINFLTGGNQDALNFSATRKTFTINGKVIDDQGSAIPGVGVQLGLISGGDLGWSYTSGDGSFSFTKVPGGYNYTLKAWDISTHAFPTQEAPELSADLMLTFEGKLRSYTISGTFTDQLHNPLAGVTVQLSGPFNRSATTDSDGNYSFNNLPAKETYQLVPSKPNYIFETPSQAINFLTFDRRADFTGLRTYVINGQVKDGVGKGLPGITVTLSGPQTGQVVTNSGGAYSFTVTAAGNYQMTPSIEQNYYLFSPSSETLSVSQNEQSANFTATLTPSTTPSYVLEFDGSQESVDYGLYWPWNVDLGHFYWEFWAMPGDNTPGRYLISDGYGGAHALLFGFGFTNDEGRYTLSGNIFDGTGSTSFIGDEGPLAGEWSHVAVGWDGKYIVTYFNGVPVGKQAFKGPRISPGPSWGASWLLIGGSDHQNLIGRIAQVRAYEGRNPRESSPEASFAPQTLFDVDGNLLSYYFRPAAKVADLSPGYFGRTNPGTPRGTANGVPENCPGCPTPKFVIDPTAPNFSNPGNPGQITAPVATPLSAPAGARSFDSFSRKNSTYILGGRGGLGSTEGGTAGAQVWQTGQAASSPQPFGILNGRAVLLKDDTSLAWINTGAPGGNLDIRVDRHPGSWGASGVNTGVSFRVVDADNYFFAYTSDSDDPAKPKMLSVGYYLNGQRTDLAAKVTMPGSWLTLRVVTKVDGSISLYAGTTLVYSTGSNVLPGATGAGLYNNAKGMALTNRWDNFTVYDVP